MTTKLRVSMLKRGVYGSGESESESESEIELRDSSKSNKNNNGNARDQPSKSAHDRDPRLHASGESIALALDHAGADFDLSSAAASPTP
eukprot:146981-Pleurochrysis_carterae.AAC.1